MQPAINSLIRERRRVASLVLVFTSCAMLLIGCGSAVKQAAKEAAPAAVEGAAEEARDPQTRDNLATLLADPEIHEASSQLAQALVRGALNGLGDAESTASIQRMTDALVARVGAAFGRSLERDIGPRLSAAVADAVGQSMQRALDANTEQRLEALARAMSRGALQGAGESMFDPMTGEPSPALQLVAGRFAREVTRQAAFGFDGAVREAEMGEAKTEGDAGVLAAIGRLSRFALTLPAALMIGGVGLVALLFVALLWALVRLWQLKREHGEPRPRSRGEPPRARDEPPHSERSATLG